MVNRKARLLVEFTALFVAVPLWVAIALPADRMPMAFFAVFAVGMVFLAITPGVRRAEIWSGWRDLDARFLWLTLGGGAVALLLVAWWFVPEMIFFLPQRMTGLWLLIMLLYPVVSALPQEIFFRQLFFRRYGGLFGREWLAVAVNAGVFGLAHLAYWNWMALGLSTAGGIIFARAYLHHGGMVAAILLHALLGMVVFTVGLGFFFYHGAISGS